MSGSLTLFPYLRRVYPQAFPEYAEILDRSVKFQVANVGRWVVDLLDPSKGDGVRDGFMRHIPNVAPVGDVMWFEYPTVWPEKDGTTQQGCLLQVILDPRYGAQHRVAVERYFKLPIPPETHWIIKSEVFSFDPTQARVGGIWEGNHWAFSFVGPDGGTLAYLPVINPHVGGSAKQTIHLVEEEVVAFAGLSFLHCKNVAVTEHYPSRQVRRAAERAGEPVVSFRTLDIHPMTEVLRIEGKSETEGALRALHICRGHFSHYTQEHPLFGKYTGTFYRPMHTRGSAAAGVVHKDYRVHTT